VNPITPPLGDCPSWCEKPAGHDWEDVWLHGHIRFHTWTRPISSPRHRRGDEIRVEESEQHTDDGVARWRTVVLDVEAPTEWDVDTAEKARDLLTEATALVRIDAPGDPQ
jgi:hypothetical protein